MSSKKGGKKGGKRKGGKKGKEKLEFGDAAALEGDALLAALPEALDSWDALLGGEEAVAEASKGFLSLEVTGVSVTGAAGNGDEHYFLRITTSKWGAPDGRVWPSDGAEAEDSKGDALEASATRSPVFSPGTDGGRVSWSAQSLPLPLTDVALASLAGVQLDIALHATSGPSVRAPAADGSAFARWTAPLASLLVPPGELGGELDMRPSAAAAAASAAVPDGAPLSVKLSARIAVDEALGDATVGGRVVNISIGSLTQLPAAWLVKRSTEDAEEEASEAECNPELNTHVYDVELALPMAGAAFPVRQLAGNLRVSIPPRSAATGGSGGDGSDFGSEEGKDGDASSTAAAAAAGGEEKGEEGDDSVEDSVDARWARAQWHVDWSGPADGSHTAFLTGAALLAFRRLGGQPLPVRITRRPRLPDDSTAAAAGGDGEAGEAVPAVVSMLAELDMSPLLQDGVARTAPQPLAFTVDAAAALPDDCQLQLPLLLSLNAPLRAVPSVLPPPPPTVAELIPPRDPLPPLPSRSASEAFRGDVARVMAQITAEYLRLFGDGSAAAGGSLSEDDGSRDVPSSADERRRTLLYTLNTSGLYHAFKEKLKRSVVRIVQAKFAKAAALSEAEEEAERDAFISQLYVLLMDEVHATLHDAVSGLEVDAMLEEAAADEAAAASSESAALLRRAEEAELSLRNDRAADFHAERVTLDERDADAWLQYGRFCLRRSQLPKAAECLREALALDGSHFAALLGYACILLYKEDLREAEVMLRAAMDSAGDDDDLLLARSLLTFLQLFMNIEDAPELEPTQLLLQRVATYLLDEHFSLLAEKALALAAQLATEPFIPGDKPAAVSGSEASAARLQSRLLRGRLAALNEDWEAAQALLEEAVDIDASCAAAWEALGHVFYLQARSDEALRAYELAVQQQPTVVVHGLYLRLGELYLHASRLEEARALFLRAAEASASAGSWLGVGTACLKLRAYEEAEEALSEANLLDNANAAVWGQLALLCLRTSRLPEAEQAFDQALQLSLDDADLLHELGHAYARIGRWQLAESALRRALTVADKRPRVRLLLGDVLLKQHLAAKALREYTAASAECDAVDDRKRALRSCVSILESLGRRDEAREFKEELRSL